jgi:hypothetical protein
MFIRLLYVSCISYRNRRKFAPIVQKESFKQVFEESVNSLHCDVYVHDQVHPSHHKYCYNTLNHFLQNKNLETLPGGYERSTL